MPAFNYKYPRPTSGKVQEGPFFKKGSNTDQSFFSASTNDTPIQTKLTIGKPGDKYEQEADAMADRVVNQPAGGANDIQAREEGIVQRMGGMEEEELQTKLEIQRMEGEEEEELQAKFELQRQETPEEEEELQAKFELQRQETPEEEEELQAKFELQRQETPEEEELQAKFELQRQEAEEEEEMLQPKAESGGPSLSSQLSGNRGKGQPLDGKTNSEMSSAFGHDFSGVNIHTDSESVQMNKDLKAQAFTHGKDVYFNEGKFNPESSSGKHLLAHELTHVVQQNKD